MLQTKYFLGNFEIEMDAVEVMFGFYSLNFIILENNNISIDIKRL